MKKRYYIAYGSNLSREQMAFRTPDAKIAGTAILTGWQLLFKVHATIEENPKKTHRCWCGRSPGRMRSGSTATKAAVLLLQKGTPGGGVSHRWWGAGTAYRDGLCHGGWA